MAKFDINAVPAPLREEVTSLLLDGLDKGLGFTVERAGELLAKSRRESPDASPEQIRKDAIGDFKHFLRVDHGWEGAVDGAWGTLETLAAAVVDAALAAGY